MKILLACMAVLLLASNVELQIRGRRKRINAAGAFKEANIPQVSGVPAPPAAIQIILNGNITVNFGNCIAPVDATELTSIGFYTSSDCYYTLIACDMDAPSAKNNYLAPWLVTLIVNIRNADIQSGNIMAEYLAPVPPPGSLKHRIVYYFFLQPAGEIDPTADCIAEYQVRRIMFPLVDFIAENKLSLVGGNYYCSEFPVDLEQLCEQTCEEYCFGTD